ncbi:MAG: carboxypeptidase M32 [Lachnospiraceae bacterium]
MSKTFDKLTPYLEKSTAIDTALTLLSWDTETLAPQDAADYTAKVVGILSGESFSALVNDEVKKLLKELRKEKEQEALSEKEQAIVKNLSKVMEQLESIPQEEYQAYNEFAAKAQGIWARAKRANRYEDFAPVLEKMLDYQKKFAGYRSEKGEDAYDILLNDNEEGFTRKELDIFFSKVKETVIPLVKQVVAKNDTIDRSFLYQKYDIAKQKEFSRYMAGYVGFDFNRGVMAESEHPFTTNLHNHDVRITNHFHEDNLESAIFSVIHESGHAIYEMGVSDELTQTPACHMSMGMHESQSRFFENIIGRNPAFWEPIYEKLVSCFPEQLSDISLDTFVHAINKAEPSLVRTEADELTYSLHILIRYEIECALFAGDITVKDLPDVWNRKYEEYLGVTPKDDAEGVMQDVHWALGSFGYFPSYAIGSAIAAQIYYYMKEHMPFEDYLREGNLTVIREFLKDHIHKYGSAKSTMELLKDMTGEEFNADYYVRYLTEKYTALYNL